MDRVTSVEPTGEPVRRPDGFDLAEAWRLVTDEVDQRGAAYRVQGTAVADLVPVLRMVFGPRLRIGPSEPDGRVAVEVSGHDLDSLAGQLAGFGNRLEVREPAEMRRRLATIGGELADLYRS